MNTTITQEKIQEISDKIAKEFKPERIILFGSWAWGTPHKDSDVDLFIVKDTENTRKTAMEISSFLTPRPFPIDIIVYTPTSFEKRKNYLFIQHIMNSGRHLYG
ncbi:nucleotidyltransferase domain-containing protein [bacterium]|nr:nucleotidyltransferase domain-containing protein [bacterium]